MALQWAPSCIRGFPRSEKEGLRDRPETAQNPPTQPLPAAGGTSTPTVPVALGGGGGGTALLGGGNKDPIRGGPTCLCPSPSTAPVPQAHLHPSFPEGRRTVLNPGCIREGGLLERRGQERGRPGGQQAQCGPGAGQVVVMENPRFLLSAFQCGLFLFLLLYVALPLRFQVGLGVTLGQALCPTPSQTQTIQFTTHHFLPAGKAPQSLFSTWEKQAQEGHLKLPEWG